MASNKKSSNVQSKASPRTKKRKKKASPISSIITVTKEKLKKKTHRTERKVTTWHGGKESPTDRVEEAQKGNQNLIMRSVIFCPKRRGNDALKSPGIVKAATVQEIPETQV